MVGPIKKPKYTAFIKAGTLFRPEDTMCKQCFKPALWEGIRYIVRMSGVAPYGKIKGCADCKVWFHFNAAGDLERTTGKGAPKKENDESN